MHTLISPDWPATLKVVVLDNFENHADCENNCSYISKITSMHSETKKTSLTNDASLSRKTRDKKGAVGGGVPPRPGAPVTPRPASPHPHQQPAPATSVGPNRHKTVRHATKEVNTVLDSVF